MIHRTENVGVDSSAIIGAGAINNPAGATLIVNNSSFIRNVADFGAGAILNDGTLSVNNSSFSENSITAVKTINGMGAVKNSTFTNNYGYAFESTYDGVAEITITGSTFSENGSGALRLYTDRFADS